MHPAEGGGRDDGEHEHVGGRENAERASDVEPANRDVARSSVFVHEQCRDEEPRQHEKCLDAEVPEADYPLEVGGPGLAAHAEMRQQY